MIPRGLREILCDRKMTRNAIGEREFAENLDKDSNAVADDVHLAFAPDSRGFVAGDFLYAQFQFGRADAAADFPVLIN